MSVEALKSELRGYTVVYGSLDWSIVSNVVQLNPDSSLETGKYYLMRVETYIDTLQTPITDFRQVVDEIRRDMSQGGYQIWYVAYKCSPFALSEYAAIYKYDITMGLFKSGGSSTPIAIIMALALILGVMLALRDIMLKDVYEMQLLPEEERKRVLETQDWKTILMVAALLIGGLIVLAKAGGK